MTAKTAEHDTVMGALRSAQDVIEGILNATQALLTSLTYPDSSTVMGAGSSPAESEAKLLLLPTRSAEKLAKELASSAKERLTLDRTAKKALRDLTTEWLGGRVRGRLWSRPSQKRCSWSMMPNNRSIRCMASWHRWRQNS